MKQLFLIFLTSSFVFFFNSEIGSAQDVKSKNSMELKLSGRIQLQHFYNNRFRTADSVTYHGFRIRRGRFQVDAKLTSFLTAKLQIEARDNSPRLKDAEAKVNLFKNYYFRFGQFKIPVWREEFKRSSGDLLLVERSAASAFLILNLLSARQIGTEFGGNLSSKLSFALNYSNGSGEGNSEIEIATLLRDEDEVELRLTSNNGKMYTGRLDYAISQKVQIGISGAVNYVGNEVDTLNNEGENIIIAPDFGIYLPSGVDLEGGIAYGKISKSFIEEAENQNYVVADFTGRWKKILGEPLENWGGLSSFELAAGLSYIDIDSNDLNQRNSYRFGPAVYFGKKSRLQVNAEIVDPAEKNEDLFWRIRSQFTINF
jgi:hypothetical protein